MSARVIVATAALAWALVTPDAPAAAAVIALPASIPAPLLKAATPPFYVVLDGRWYVVRLQQPFIWFDKAGVRAPAADMDNCRRSDGQPMPFTFYAFYYGPFFRPLYQLREVRYQLGVTPLAPHFLELWTIPGNVICDREVPAPDLVDAAGVFEDGFEP